MTTKVSPSFEETTDRPFLIRFRCFDAVTTSRNDLICVIAEGSTKPLQLMKAFAVHRKLKLTKIASTSNHAMAKYGPEDYHQLEVELIPYPYSCAGYLAFK